MALPDVGPGSLCAGLSVVRVTTISSINVRILDVLDAQRLESARIPVRVSGPAVDETGIGPGFSGSPILCTASDGSRRNIGAIAESVGEYGGKTALARPIVRVRRGVRQAFITGVSARGRARRGRKLTVRLRLRHLRAGRRTTRKIRIRVPRSLRPGRRTLRLTGTPGDVGSDPLGDVLSIVFEDEENADDPGPESVAEIRGAFQALHRPNGVEVSFGRAASARQVYRDPACASAAGRACGSRSDAARAATDHV